MKGVRFYEDFTDKRNKRKGESQGNVIAVFPENTWLRCDEGVLYRMFDGIGAVYFYPNSPVGGCNVSQGYLWESCKRVSEAKARQVHPSLFAVLDQAD